MWTFLQHYRSSSSSNKAWPTGRRGFTLIELLVVISIMIIITAVMLFNQARFDSSTLLRSLGYSVALSVRQAQLYGTSVVGTTTTQAACTNGSYYSGACYASAYGIYVTSSNPTSYILFADLNGNGKYNSGEDVKVFQFNNGYTISKFCATNQSSTAQCSDTTISSLSIIFKRPNPDASFVALDSGGVAIPGDVYSKAYIQVKHNADTNIRNICITVTGQIAVQPQGVACL